MVTFNKRKQLFGYPKVRGYYTKAVVEPFGELKFKVDVIDFHGVERHIMSFASVAVAFVPYQDQADLNRRPSYLYRQLREEFPDCTPHHHVDGFMMVPMDIHASFPHDGPVSLLAFERGERSRNVSAVSLKFKTP